MAQRELSDREIDDLLSEQRIVRVAFSAKGAVYLLPLGYVWRDGALHLMTTTGRKTEMAGVHGHVAFQIDNSAEKGMLGWSSVTGEGTWDIVSDQDLQATIGAAVVARFPELVEWAAREASEKQRRGNLVFARIQPLRMTGRAFVKD